MIEALMGTIQYSNEIYESNNELISFQHKLRQIIHNSFKNNMGTRDICGEKGLTTESFIEHISNELNK